MNRWYHVPDRDKRIAYDQLGEQTNLPAFAVEKDWWVVQTLTILFELEIGNHLVFKGGTSLSKVETPDIVYHLRRAKVSIAGR